MRYSNIDEISNEIYETEQKIIELQLKTDKTVMEFAMLQDLVKRLHSLKNIKARR